MTECCGTCKWHRHEDIDDGWVCVNDRSEYCADWTECNDWCKHFEECEDEGSQYEIDKDLECIGFEDSEVDENG